jgi:hypothetical protein
VESSGAEASFPTCEDSRGEFGDRYLCSKGSLVRSCMRSYRQACATRTDLPLRGRAFTGARSAREKSGDKAPHSKGFAVRKYPKSRCALRAQGGLKDFLRRGNAVWYFFAWSRETGFDHTYEFTRPPPPSS